MAKPGTVIGWTLDREQRVELLERFPPAYSRIDAHHVTLRTDAAAETLPTEATARIVGHADDGDSLEAMVVEVDGTTDRPDGSTYHITWSLGEGRRARESNDLIRDRGWQPVDPVALILTPARF